MGRLNLKFENVYNNTKLTAAVSGRLCDHAS
jgi:hypothetical protein